MSNKGKGYPRQINDGYEVLPLDAVKPHPRNPRRGDLDAIKASVDVNGFYGAVVANKRTGYILAGNHRWMAAKALELPEIPVVWVDVGDAEEKRILAADNRTAELGGYDDAVLASLLQGLQDDGGLLGTGYAEEDLSELINGLTPDFMEEPLEEKPLSPADQLLEKWEVKRGQIWQAGSHRVMCGSCTDLDQVRLLLGDRRPECVWTDPPYGVDYKGKTEDALTILNDTADGLEALLDGCFGVLVEVMSPGAAIYVAHPPGALQVTFVTKFASHFSLRQQLVWVKSSMALGHSDYHYKHEPILFGYTQGEGRRGRGGAGWYGDNAQVSVLEYDKPNRNSLHPTMKPVELVAHCVRNSAPLGGLVFDPFGGSGSTLMACHQTGRHGASMELDPRFVSVHLQRLEDAGLTPELIEEA